MTGLKNELITTLVDKFGYEREDIKLLTNGKLKQMILEEEKDLEAFEQKTITNVKKSKLDKNTIVEIRSGLPGTLFYHCERTNKDFTFQEFGTRDEMTYEELLILKNRYPKYLTEAWLLILENQELQKEFGLTEIYKNIVHPDKVDDLFALDVNELREVIDKMPEGAKSAFLNIAMKKVEDGTLDSQQKIKMIEGKFNISFNDNAPLNDVVLKDTTDNFGIIRL
ncbi:MAG: hypothetical protein ACRC4N_02500 [Gammaproteobacteria bacterium]